MAGRKKVIKEEQKIIKPVQHTGWTVDVKLLKSLLTPYRISGKVDDIVSVPADLVDKLVEEKKVVKV